MIAEYWLFNGESRLVTENTKLSAAGGNDTSSRVEDKKKEKNKVSPKSFKYALKIKETEKQHLFPVFLLHVAIHSLGYLWSPVPLIQIHMTSVY